MCETHGNMQDNFLEEEFEKDMAELIGDTASDHEQDSLKMPAIASLRTSYQ